MSGDKRALLKQWLASGKARLQPLAFPQRELWEASPVPVGDMANHICCLIDVRGGITPQLAEAAIGLVVARQEVLRLSFLPGKEGFVQMIRDTCDLNFQYRELSEAEAKPEALEATAQEIFRAPFDLMQGPLYRVEMLRKGPADYVLAFAIHHAIADGWSLGVFIQDLCIAYLQERMGMKDPLELPPLSYSDWGAAERAFWQPAEIQPRAAFWKEHLAGARRIWSHLEGPATASGAHHRIVEHLPADLVGGIKELTKRKGATLFSTLLTGFQSALARWTGEQDIVVGTPVANRSRQASRETMGYFAGIVPLRGNADPSRTFSESLRTVQQSTVDCFGNAMPFAELARELGDPGAPGHNPLFEVRFALQNHPVPEVTLSGLSAKLSMRSTGTARFHLACEITEEGDRLEVVWLFRPTLFSAEEIEKLTAIFKAILAGACRSPDDRIGSHTI